MGRKFFQKFGVRVTAAIVLSMLVVVFLSALIIYQLTFGSQMEVRTDPFYAGKVGRAAGV
jgi:hypothetical protein